MRNIVSIVLSINLFLMTIIGNGCGGRTARPVSMTRYTDNSLTCNELQTEMDSLERQIVRKEETQKKNDAGDWLWFAGGVFFFPLWFGMDIKDAEKVEAEALKDRQDHLRTIFDSKCTPEQIAKRAELKAIKDKEIAELKKNDFKGEAELLEKMRDREKNNWRRRLESPKSPFLD